MARPYLKLPAFTLQQIQRFGNSVQKRDDKECWPWIGSRDPKGNYGIFYFTDGRVEHNTRAHRVAYFLNTGIDPGPQLIRHNCDNPPCCNPAHLLPGTQADNVRDRVLRNRSSKGDSHYSRLRPEVLARGCKHGSHLHPEKIKRGQENGNAKLEASQVRKIKQLLGTCVQREIAIRFNVSKATIAQISTGRTWKHIT